MCQCVKLFLARPTPEFLAVCYTMHVFPWVNIGVTCEMLLMGQCYTIATELPNCYSRVGERDTHSLLCQKAVEKSQHSLSLTMVLSRGSV